MKLLSEMRDVHAGQPIAVLGGGPSLPGDVERLPAGAVLIAVNYHADHLLEPDYLVFLDSPGHVPRLLDIMPKYESRRISTTPGYTDWRIDVQTWDAGITSTFATWLACFFGGDPVLLCGMDCYTTGPHYFHGLPMTRHPCQGYPLGKHLEPWHKALKHCDGEIRAMSGPLVEIFGEYGA
jgi:hypothetical protein